MKIQCMALFVEKLMTEKQQQLYEWNISYTDGTLMNEVDIARPDGRSWHEREDKPVQAVTLFSTVGLPVVCVFIPEGAEPVFFSAQSGGGQHCDGRGKRRASTRVGWADIYALHRLEAR